MRVTFFCSVNSEDEGRNKLKRFISLRIMLSISDRKGAPVGNLAEITTKAKTIAYDENVDVVTEEEEEQNDSQEDDGIESVKGEIEPTEAPDIEEADNMTPNNEESKTTQTQQAEDEKIEEDMTVPENLMVIEDVQNWEERMNKANYNEMQRNAVS